MLRIQTKTIQAIERILSLASKKRIRLEDSTRKALIHIHFIPPLPQPPKTMEKLVSSEASDDALPKNMETSQIKFL